MWKNNRRYHAHRIAADTREALYDTAGFEPGDLRRSRLDGGPSAQFASGQVARGSDDADGDRGSMSRREVLGYAAIGAAGAAAATVAGRGGATAAPAYLKGLGDFRRLSVVNHRTGERLNVIYFADGEYIPEAVDELSYIMRDWRRNEVMPIDSRTLDFAAAVYKRVDTSEPLQIISGYRSPKTNAMLRSKGRGVAKNSFHTRGMALDLSLQSRSVAQMYRAALSLKGGGVGRYTRAHFMHVDCGPNRSWGR